jgi:dTDP-3-amino-3,4,6-trideoxy-alpha-D-glucose transaminase
MTVAFLDLRRQAVELRGELAGAFADVLEAGRYVGGPAVESFERSFAAWCGTSEAVGVASGTQAIELALRALGIGAGDEVITAANTCVPTVAAVEATGATPVLVDADEDTCTLDPGELADAITARTRAIVPVHLYGRCAEMEAVAGFAREHGLAVVEDAAQAHGAELDGRRAGTLAAAGAFSFYPTKNLGALGDAGAVTTDDPELAERLRALRSFGERGRGEAVERGTNSRLDALQAAFLSAKLERLDAWNARRRELARRYLDALDGLPVGLPRERPGERHAYHLFVVCVRRRDEVRAELARRGIETLVHYPRAVQEHPAYRRLDRPGRLGRSEHLARDVLSLPLYPELTDDEADTVAAALREVLAA